MRAVLRRRAPVLYLGVVSRSIRTSRDARAAAACFFLHYSLVRRLGALKTLVARRVKKSKPCAKCQVSFHPLRGGAHSCLGWVAGLIWPSRVLGLGLGLGSGKARDLAWCGACSARSGFGFGRRRASRRAAAKFVQTDWASEEAKSTDIDLEKGGEGSHALWALGRPLWQRAP